MHLAGSQVEVRSASSAPVGKVNAAVVEAMVKVGVDVSTKTPRFSPVATIGTNSPAGLGRILCLQQRALGSTGCARAGLTAEATGVGPVVDRTPPLTDHHKGFQLVIDGTLTGGAPPQGPAPAPKQLEAEELQWAENAAAEVLNSNRTDTWRCAAGLSGTAELPPGEGADQQRTSEDGGRLRPETTAWWA